MKEKVYEKPVIEFMGFNETDVITESVSSDGFVDPMSKWGI